MNLQTALTTATALDNILASVQTPDGNIKAADPGAITPTPPVGS